MKKTLWTLFTLAAVVMAQEKPSTPPEPISKMIPVRYVNTNHLQNLLSVPGVSIKADEGMHVLVVYGRPDAVSTIEEMVKKLDVAPPPPPARPNVELNVYMVTGSMDGKARGDEIPPDLASAVKQLHQLFPYRTYRLLNSFVLRGRDGERGETKGLFPNPLAGEQPASYNFQYRAALVGDGNPRTIRLNNLSMHTFVLVPRTVTNKAGEKTTEYAPYESSVSTDVDVREGQKVVVGKSNFGTEDAFILVVTAKVVE